MNIKDVEKRKLKEGEDMLKLIFERQEELERKYQAIERKNGFYVPHNGKCDIDNAKDQQYIKNLTHRVIEELEEAMNCLKNKPWKQSQMETDKDHFYEELADGFHFYVALMLATGLDAETIFQTYFKKSEVNKFRQRSGY